MMAKMLSRVAPWLTSAKADREPGGRAVSTLAGPGRLPGMAAGGLRVLADADTPALQALVDLDPVANIFLASHLENAGSASATGAGAIILGYFDGGRLLAACWVGSNIVPVNMPAAIGAEVGEFLIRYGRTYASVFGPAEGVLGIWSSLQHGLQQPHDVRPNQPLLVLAGEPSVSPVPTLRLSTPADFDVVLPACAAMFEEELGYSPYTGGAQHYRNRVRWLIEQQYSLIDTDPQGRIIFKAELGAVSAGATQIQGVWINPEYRGRGLSAGYMAAVVAHARRLAPAVSLYVNDYNQPALAAYRRVGFEQVGTFATVLF